MRKTYGNTWWGQQWLNALNNIDFSNRLPRGRTYANKGAVTSIDIEDNTISAFVQGSRRTPYRVNISIPTYTSRQKAKVVELITSNPLYLSHLLNRELPNQLFETCEDEGIHIFPHSWDDLNGGCSCPDWAVPCKHMAAVLYLVANEIDKNPFLVFELHDFDLFKALDGIGYGALDQKEVPILSVDQIKTTVSPEGEKVEEADQTVRDQIDLSVIPYFLDNLLAVLQDQAVFYPVGDFKKLLGKVYKKVGGSVYRLSDLNKESSTSTNYLSAETVELWLDGNGRFLECTFWKDYDTFLFDLNSPEELTAELEKVPVGDLHLYCQDFRDLHLIYQLAKKIAEQAAFIPQLLQSGEKTYLIRWIPAFVQEEVKRCCQLVKKAISQELILYKEGEEFTEPERQDYLQALISIFLNHFVHTYHGLERQLWSDEIPALFFGGIPIRFDRFETREFPSAIQLWLHRLYISEKDYVPILLVKEKEEQFEVILFLEDKTQPVEAPIPLSELFLNKAYQQIRINALRDLAMLSEYFPEIGYLIASQGKEKLTFSSNSFTDVLLRIIPTIKLLGIKVVLPRALQKLLRPQISLELLGEDKGIVALSSIIGLDNLLRFNWQIAIGEESLSPEEFHQLVAHQSGIVKFRDQYVYFDEKQIQQLIDRLEEPPQLNGNDILQVALTEEYQGARIRMDKSAQQLLDRLLNGEQVPLPEGLNAVLRPYQVKGFEWLYNNARIGFGCLIADDMGLGKTLQVITTLLKFKEEGLLGNQKALVVVPTTLLTNWSKEIQKFTEGLSAHIYHGPSRNFKDLAQADIILTTYGIIRSEANQLRKEKWLAIVIDEAQNIKNPATAQTKAIKKIKAPIRIAMSGTPVENRLSEYWSIFDFTNPKYLGSLKHFKETFAIPIEQERDQTQLKRFRQITAPFLIRRLKTDKTIISDLPDKIEKDQYCQLTADQAALYQSVLDNTMDNIQKSDGINRRGLILKLITALKQICNHPKHFLKKGASDPSLSGKAQLLMELLRQCLDNNQKTLIFTQYREMGDLMAEIIHSDFGMEVPFLHGGVSRKNRDEMVEDFQTNRSTRIMLLSLKAGGTGLNLTAAGNVIHYDLWWNPAVERQATDRAFRIGQKNNVLVHRFITQATFEEKINKLLESKKELADLTVSSGEKWIGDLSNEELKEVVQLEK